MNSRYLRLSLFVLVFLGIIYPAAAYSYTHTITDGSGDSVISVGEIALDKVNSSSGNNGSMKFWWKKETVNKPKCSETVDYMGPTPYNFMSTCNSINEAGDWYIEWEERQNPGGGGSRLGQGSVSFNVYAAPEFYSYSLGLMVLLGIYSWLKQKQDT